MVDDDDTIADYVENMKEHKYAAHVLFYQDDSLYFCSAVILEKNKILTAAHCMKKKSTFSTNVTLAVGAMEIDDLNHTLDVTDDEIFIHPEFDDSWLNDLAVIQLKKSLKFDDNVGKIDLDKKYKPERKLNVVLAGYSDDYLRYVNTTTVAFKKCRDSYLEKENRKLMAGKQFCVKIGNLNINGGYGGGITIK